MPTYEEKLNRLLAEVAHSREEFSLREAVLPVEQERSRRALVEQAKAEQRKLGLLPP